MKINALVSVIVPVYNAEKFISQCIRSILSQSYQKLEIILVNDGSTDNSGNICDMLAQRDTRILVIHQQNKGPAAARNKGLATATGLYVQFIDADDTIKRLMTEKLVAKMSRQTDLVVCGYETDEAFIPEMEGLFDKKTFLTYVGALYKDIILPSPCNKMYRLDVIKQHHIHFLQDKSLGEDLLFNLAYLTYCRFIYVTQDVFYTYRINRTSLTNAFIPFMYEKQKEIHQHMRQFLIENDCATKENTEAVETICANGIIHATTNLFHPDNPFTTRERKGLVKNMITHADTVRQLPYFTDSLQARMYRYFVKRKADRQAYSFFRFKKFLQHHVSGLFNLLKRMNQ